MKSLEYEVRERDILAFNESRSYEMPEVRANMRTHRFILPGVFLTAGAVLGFYYKEPVLAGFMVVLALFWSLVLPVYIRWHIRRQLRPLCASPSLQSACGHYKLRIEPDSLVETSGERDTKVKWCDVKGVQTIRNYAFLHLSDGSSLVIPKLNVTGGDFDEFVKNTRRRIEGAA